jgi:hypothetical protein
MLRPKVRPPIPHKAPKSIANNFDDPGAVSMMEDKVPDGTVSHAKRTGTITQENTP